MGCSRGLCSAHKLFIFINIAFAMYAGALLATAARLAWDPSTYTWFRFLCEAQYRASAAYVLAAGLWLAALVYLAAAAARASTRAHTRSLHIYAAGVIVLVASEVAYGAWMAASLARWWRESPQAQLARRGMDLVHDIKPALLAIERYRDVARPLYEMIEEVEREAPNNVFVIIVFGAFGAVLQIAAFVMARRLAQRGAHGKHGTHGGCAAPLGEKEKELGVCAAPCPCPAGGGAGACDEDSDSAGERDPRDPPPGWRKKANLRMYTILDKIF